MHMGRQVGGGAVNEGGRLRKSLARQKLSAVVGDDHLESQFGGEADERNGIVTCPADNEPRAT
jgi:hypothetical protein